MHIGTARNNMREIGQEIGERLKAVMDANPELSVVEVCMLRPDLAIETATFTRCWLAMEDG